MEQPERVHYRTHKRPLIIIIIIIIIYYYFNPEPGVLFSSVKQQN